MRQESNEDGLPSPQAQEGLLRLLLLSGGRRISSATLDNRTVWIKRYDVERPPVTKRLHQVISPLLPVFLRASRVADAQALVERELRKLEAFRQAGIAVPAVVHHGAAVLVLTHVAGIADLELNRLRETDPDAHDALLVGAAAALGRAHSAGLCHGRPHTRDMFLADGRWGFVDFEEEPEAVMPLGAAQARDLWLLFLQISTRALRGGTEGQALAAYFQAGPHGTLAGLQSIIRFFSPLLPPLALVEKVWLGSDGRRLLKATRFLKRALQTAGAECAASNRARLGAAEGVKEGP